MPRPRVTHEELDLLEKIRKSKFVKEQLTVLFEECEEAGIPIDDVRHYWYKSKRMSIFAKNHGKSYEKVRDEIIGQMQDHVPIYPPITREPVTDPHLLVMDPSDIHIGKLAVAAETGDEYNIDTAIHRAEQGVRGIMGASAGYEIDQVLFIIGNDALHIDHPHRKTTAGTPQDTDGMWHTAFHAAKDMYVRLIEMQLSLADVHVLYCPSNHDFTHGFFLADTLKSWFRTCPNVTFDVDIIHRKYYQYGSNMIEADHGDGCKVKDTPTLMAHEAAQMWAYCKFRYSYKHHLHHKIKAGAVIEMGLDAIGANIEFLRTPSLADGWHHRNGYVNIPAVEGFIHHKDKGRVAHLTHYF